MSGRGSARTRRPQGRRSPRVQPRSTACEPGLGIAAVRCTCCVGVAVLGTTVLGVAVLGTAVLQRGTAHSTHPTAHSTHPLF
jgi:hypothetical protein